MGKLTEREIVKGARLQIAKLIADVACKVADVQGISFPDGEYSRQWILHELSDILARVFLATSIDDLRRATKQFGEVERQWLMTVNGNPPMRERPSENAPF